MAVSGPKNAGEMFWQINITPLTDIFLVLLIIFMVTTSVTIEAASHVDLPLAENTSPENKGVIVTLHRPARVVRQFQGRDRARPRVGLDRCADPGRFQGGHLSRRRESPPGRHYPDLQIASSPGLNRSRSRPSASRRDNTNACKQVRARPGRPGTRRDSGWLATHGDQFESVSGGVFLRHQHHAAQPIYSWSCSSFSWWRRRSRLSPPPTSICPRFNPRPPPTSPKGVAVMYTADHRIFVNQER